MQNGETCECQDGSTGYEYNTYMPFVPGDSANPTAPGRWCDCDPFDYNQSRVHVASLGETYGDDDVGMADASERSRLLRDAVKNVSGRLALAIRAADPCGALVTTGYWQPTLGAMISRPWLDPGPITLVEECNGGIPGGPCEDFHSIHTWPDSIRYYRAQGEEPLDPEDPADLEEGLNRVMRELGYDQELPPAKPLLFADTCGGHFSYPLGPTLAERQEMAEWFEGWQRYSCEFDVAGWTLWDWELATADDGLVGHFLAPAVKPDACQELPLGVIELKHWYSEFDDDPCKVVVQYWVWLHPIEESARIRRFIDGVEQGNGSEFPVSTVTSLTKPWIVLDFDDGDDEKISRILVDVPSIWPRQEWQNRWDTFSRPAGCRVATLSPR
jgi:hypothetical protein